jgi:hypothetical protein
MSLSGELRFRFFCVREGTTSTSCPSVEMLVIEITGEGVADGSDEPSSGVKTSRSERESPDADRWRALRVLAELYPLGLR